MRDTISNQQQVDQQAQAALSAVEDATRLAGELRNQIDEHGRVRHATSLQDTANCFRSDLITEGRLSDSEALHGAADLVSHVALQGVGFRSSKALPPGTIKYLRTDGAEASLHSKIRIVSCRLRADGAFDIKAEFF